ncbi:MAG: B12-binding domain-containing radical SAM protein [Bryobacteraceae bacterium]
MPPSKSPISPSPRDNRGAPLKVCLVSIPTATDFEDPIQFESEGVRETAAEIPLGVLALAAVLEQAGTVPQIVDSNAWYVEYVHAARTTRSTYSEFAADRLASLDADLYGFSTICNSYPVTIQTAQHLKRLRPSAVTLFGGPQASVVDLPTLRHFPFVDFILRGEADATFPEFVARLSAGQSLESVPAIAYRSAGEPRRNANAPLPVELDALPLPAFHLYPGQIPARSIPLELGRGCPFGCTFCSTNDFFRRRFRLKSTAILLREMDLLTERYAAEYFDLMHDMFTVDRRRVVAFCEAMLASGRGYRWGCSARTDCVDPELIELMARAGCVSIFFGVESGSPRIQKIIDKRLDLAEARAHVTLTTRHGMRTTVSTIVGFPEETIDDVKATVGFLAESLREPELVTQFHLLAPLAGTPLEVQYRDQLVLEDLYTDMSHSGWVQADRERQLIAAYPDVFQNFYAIPTPHLDRRYLQELREFILRTTCRFRWMLAAWHDRCGDLISLFDEWRAFSRGLVPHQRGCDMRRYYGLWTFDRDFVRFLRSRPAEARGEFEEVLLQFEEALLCVLREEAPENLPTAGNVLESDMRVALNPHVYVLHLDGDVTRVVELLRAHQPPDESIRRPVIVATRRASEDEIQALRISPLSAEFLALCDGAATVDEILERFAPQCPAIGSLSPWDVATEALRLAYRNKLIRAFPANDSAACAAA